MYNLHVMYCSQNVCSQFCYNTPKCIMVPYCSDVLLVLVTAVLDGHFNALLL